MANQISVTKTIPYAIIGAAVPNSDKVTKVCIYAIVNSSAPVAPPGGTRRWLATPRSIVNNGS